MSESKRAGIVQPCHIGWGRYYYPGPGHAPVWRKGSGDLVQDPVSSTGGFRKEDAGAIEILIFKCHMQDLNHCLLE